MSKALRHEVRGSGFTASPFSTSVLDKVNEWLASYLGSFTPGQITRAHWMGWVGPKADPNAMEKRKGLFPLPDIDWPAHISSLYRLSCPGSEVRLQINVDDTYAVT
jgi:hypothetical protein